MAGKGKKKRGGGSVFTFDSMHTGCEHCGALVSFGDITGHVSQAMVHLVPVQ